MKGSPLTVTWADLNIDIWEKLTEGRKDIDSLQIQVIAYTTIKSTVAKYLVKQIVPNHD